MLASDHSASKERALHTERETDAERMAERLAYLAETHVESFQYGVGRSTLPHRMPDQ